MATASGSSSAKKKKSSFVTAPIDKLGTPALAARHFLLECILRGTPVLLGLQRCRTPLMNKLMVIMSFLGTEEFYTPLVLCIAWVVDMKLGRMCAILMAAGFYVASFFKNCLCLPRPPTPPVIPLERAYDWALPSHHSILGVVMPFYIFFYAYEKYSMSLEGITLLFLVIGSWSFLVMFSRMYLGVHSPADIVSGGILGVLLLSLFLNVDEYVDYKSGYGQAVALQTLTYSLILLAVHPQTQPQTLSFADTVCLAGVVCGVMVARGRTATQTSPMYRALMEQKDILDNDQLASYTSVALYALPRLAIGFAAILGARAVLKVVVRAVLQYVFNMVNIPAYSFSQHIKAVPMPNKHHTIDYVLPPLHEKDVREGGEGDRAEDEDEEDGGDETRPSLRPFDLDIPCKLVTYTVMGWMMTEGCLHIFHWCGLNLISSSTGR